MKTPFPGFHSEAKVCCIAMKSTFPSDMNLPTTHSLGSKPCSCNALLTYVAASTNRPPSSSSTREISLISFIREL